MKDEIRQLILGYFQREHPELSVAAQGGEAGDLPVKLEPPRDSGHGDLASNVAMAAAGRLGCKPRALAENLAAALNESLAGRAVVEVAGPGFLNIRLSRGQVQESLKKKKAHL